MPLEAGDAGEEAEPCGYGHGEVGPRGERPERERGGDERGGVPDDRARGTPGAPERGEHRQPGLAVVALEDDGQAPEVARRPEEEDGGEQDGRGGESPRP